MKLARTAVLAAVVGCAHGETCVPGTVELPTATADAATAFSAVNALDGRVIAVPHAVVEQMPSALAGWCVESGTSQAWVCRVASRDLVDYVRSVERLRGPPSGDDGP